MLRYVWARLSSSDRLTLVFGLLLLFIAFAAAWNGEVFIPARSTKGRFTAPTHGAGLEALYFSWVVLAWGYITVRVALVRTFPLFRWYSEVSLMLVFMAAAGVLYWLRHVV
jgi:hypothetical protein